MNTTVFCYPIAFAHTPMTDTFSLICAVVWTAQREYPNSRLIQYILFAVVKNKKVIFVAARHEARKTLSIITNC